LEEVTINQRRSSLDLEKLRDSAWFRYGLSLILTAALLFTSYLLFRVLPHNPGLFGITAVALAAWKLGLGPGLLSAAIGAFAVRPLFLPYGRLIPQTGEFVRLGIYLALTLLISALVAGRRRSEAALRQSNQELEQRVKERTAELQAANQKLEQSLEQLKQSNAALEQFAYVCSHDLKEPLRTITAYVELLKTRYAGKLDSDADDFINYVVNGTTKMNDLITSLLEYSKAGRDTTPERLDSASIVRSVVENLNPMIEESKATIHIGPLPEVTADRQQISRLFQNLISNGIKYRNSLPPQIDISARKLRAEWQFSVKDNGIGIDPVYHEKIFNLFQRLHHGDQYPGTGIGLSVCRQIVECQGGRIWVESQPGAGATFHFTVPER
jgi:signal transduction histidine kinase